MTADWQPTACILCECNCGIVVQVEDRTLARIRGDKEHPASQGYTCNKALRLDHYQNNRARLTSPMRRRADGSYEEIDWDTAIVEIAEGFKHIRDTYGGDKIFYYGGGGQGNHLGGAYSGAFLKALGSRYRSNALAQEKTGEAWVDAHLYGGHTRGEFEHAEVSVFVGKNPWMSQSFPAGAGGAQRDRQRPGAVDDRDRPGAHRHREDGRLPPAGAAGYRRVVSGRSGRRSGSGKPLQRSISRRARARRRRRARRAARSTGRRLRAALRGGRGAAAGRGAAHRRRGQRLGVRRPRHSAGTQQHPVLLSEQAAVDPHRQLREKGWPAPAFVVRTAVQPGLRTHAGHRRADHRRAGAVQRGARGDPDRPPGPVPGDDRRERQSRSFAGRFGRLPRRHFKRWN